MRTLDEIEATLKEGKHGPAAFIAMADLIAMHKALEAQHKALRTAYVADTDGLDPDEAEKKYLK